MSPTEALGYIAAILVLLTFSMTTMVHLRIVGILSNVFFIAYGYLSSAYPITLLHCILLPLNILRLTQLLALVRKVESASDGEINMDWLRSVSTPRLIKAGEMLFRKGDKADRMMFVMSGAFRIGDLGIEISKGQFIGELGLLAPGQARTQSVECAADSEVLEITYEQAKALYFQSPKFGFYLLQLVSRRLFDDVQRLEQELKACRAGMKQPA
jgi:hypothetical protein